MTSIKDVALRSEVSTATVSHVLNNRNEKFNEETRSRVLKAMRDLKYRPEAVRKRSARPLSNSIGIAFTHYGSNAIYTPYHVDILEGISRLAMARHLSVLTIAPILHKDIRSNLRIFCDGRCDGLIVFTPEVGLAIDDAARERGLPCVLVNAHSSNAKTSTVDIDNYLAARAAAEHLIALGHSRIAVLHGELNYAHAQDRLLGTRDALVDAGLQMRSDYVVAGEFLSESGYVRALGLMGLPAHERPTGYLCGNDDVALGVIRAAKERGVRVPIDVSIVGFDDASLTSVSDPPLTTMRVPLQQMGEVAAELVHGIVQGNKPQGHKVRLDFELIVRDSTARAPST